MSVYFTPFTPTERCIDLYSLRELLLFGAISSDHSMSVNWVVTPKWIMKNEPISYDHLYVFSNPTKLNPALLLEPLSLEEDHQIFEYFKAKSLDNNIPCLFQNTPYGIDSVLNKISQIQSQINDTIRMAEERVINQIIQAIKDDQIQAYTYGQKTETNDIYSDSSWGGYEIIPVLGQNVSQKTNSKTLNQMTHPSLINTREEPIDCFFKMIEIVTAIKDKQSSLESVQTSHSQNIFKNFVHIGNTSVNSRGGRPVEYLWEDLTKEVKRYLSENTPKKKAMRKQLINEPKSKKGNMGKLIKDMQDWADAEGWNSIPASSLIGDHCRKAIDELRQEENAD